MVKKIKKPNLDNEKIVSKFIDFNNDLLIRDFESLIFNSELEHLIYSLKKYCNFKNYLYNTSVTN